MKQLDGVVIVTVLVECGLLPLAEGEAGVERVVRIVSPNGNVRHFEGERMVRVVYPDGLGRGPNGEGKLLPAGHGEGLRVQG